MPVTTTELTRRIRERTDKENDDHVSDDPEILSLINEGLSELWELIDAANEKFFETSTTFTLAAGVSSVSFTTLGVTPLRLYSLERKYGARYRNPLPVVPWNERQDAQELSWDVVADAVHLFPEEEAPGDYRLWYVPAYTNLTAGESTHARIQPGWEEYVICHAGAVLLGKSDDEAGRLDKRKSDLADRIRKMAKRRISGMPRRIADVREARRFRHMTRSGWPVT